MTAPHLDPTTLHHLGRRVVFEHDDDPEPILARFSSFEFRGRTHRMVIVRHGDYRVEMTVPPDGSARVNVIIPTEKTPS